MKNSPLHDADKNLYFVAIIPPEPYKSELYELKRKISDNFGGKASLKSPAHITLFPPFIWKDKKKDFLHQCISSCLTFQSRFYVELEGFERFDHRVFYVKVNPEPQLHILHKIIQIEFETHLKLNIDRYGGKAFHPHLTLAFRDFPKNRFPDLLHHFEEQNYRAKFEVDSIYLLRHNGKNWEIDTPFRLQIC
jgi:2'-5' RNA ligase